MENFAVDLGDNLLTISGLTIIALFLKDRLTAVLIGVCMLC